MTNLNPKHHKPKILVTGGSGFLGKRIVEELLSEDNPFEIDSVAIFDTKPYDGIYKEKVTQIQGDISDRDTVIEALKKIDLVIHTAAIIDWGTHPEEVVLDINVNGTRNVIDACKINHVENLIYTSSLDAVYTGKPMIGVDESQPYPEKHLMAYGKSKHLSELAVTKAHQEGLKTIILRPADIYGENDAYHVGSLIAMAKTGFYVRIGNGKAKCQHVYVGNMAFAHVLAAKALWENRETVNGQIYFITDGEAMNFFKFYDRIVIRAGYKLFPKNLWFPYKAAYFLAGISEAITRLMRPVVRYNPKFSRFAVNYICTDYTFSTDKAQKELGFYPKYSRGTAIEKTGEYYKKQA